jgi:hypothetical protein
MAAPGTPDIRGEQREELINDLARGDLTHAQLGEKYGRHPQGIANFAVRNKAEIAVVQAGHNKALHERLAAIPIADQVRRIAVNGLLRDDLLNQLEDPNLDLVHRNRLTKTAMALNRAVAEEMGDLRTKLDVAALFIRPAELIDHLWDNERVAIRTITGLSSDQIDELKRRQARIRCC